MRQCRTVKCSECSHSLGGCGNRWGKASFLLCGCLSILGRAMPRESHPGLLLVVILRRPRPRPWKRGCGRPPGRAIPRPTHTCCPRLPCTPRLSNGNPGRHPHYRHTRCRQVWVQGQGLLVEAGRLVRPPLDLLEVAAQRSQRSGLLVGLNLGSLQELQEGSQAAWEDIRHPSLAHKIPRVRVDCLRHAPTQGSGSC